MKPNRVVSFGSVLALACTFAPLSTLGQEHPVSGRSKVLSGQEAVNVVAYWTAERLANAKPMELLSADRSAGNGIATAGG